MDDYKILETVAFLAITAWIGRRVYRTIRYKKVFPILWGEPESKKEAPVLYWVHLTTVSLYLLGGTIVTLASAMR